MKKLTRKQKAFADALLKDTKKSATQAVKETYNVTTDLAARAIASENLTKANIVAYLDIHAETASNTVLQVMKHSTDKMMIDDKSANNWANTALTASKDILDRVHGKATQNINQQSTSVNLSVSLSDILKS